MSTAFVSEEGYWRRVLEWRWRRVDFLDLDGIGVGRRFGNECYADLQFLPALHDDNVGEPRSTSRNKQIMRLSSLVRRRRQGQCGSPTARLGLNGVGDQPHSFSRDLATSPFSGAAYCLNGGGMAN